MSKIVMTKADLIQTASNLMSIIEDSGITQEAIQDNLCESFFGCDFKTALSQSYLNSDRFEEEAAVFVLATVGSNTILARNGVYVAATNPGTDMEIPYRALESQAMAMAHGEGGTIREVELPKVISDIPFDSDDQLVELMERMQLFSRDYNIFNAIPLALGSKDSESNDRFDLVIDGDVAEQDQIEYFSDELEIMPNYLDDEVVMTAITRTRKGVIVETAFTFENLCNAKYRSDRTWEVPLPTNDDTVTVSLR